LRSLQVADAERTALEASTRLAREVHDGLSQDLWLAKLKQARLAQAPDLPEPARELVSELGDAMDRALADARSIVTAMRESPVDRSLADSLRRAAEDFERDTGIRTQVDVAAPLPDVGIAAAGELMRIVREALTNVRKHADATTVHVAARVAAGSLEVTVADNGRGFESAELRASTYGIQGMNERAELVGGSLQVSSRRADGTTVRATVPIPAKRANPEEPA
jgi:signal transduction histidine kinase